MKKIYLAVALILAFFSFKINMKALTNISINNNKLIPEFDINTKIYNVFVSSKTEIITINVTEEENEIITGSGSKSLKKGLNEIEIISYKNEEINATYKLNIFRGEVKPNETDASLKFLNIENHEIDFETNNYSYFIDANDEENRINLNYETTSPTATVKVSGDLLLTKVKNIIKIVVTSEDRKNSNTYKITVYKDLEEPEKKLKKTSIFDGKEFSSYELKLIIGALISIGVIILGILFYLIFIRNRKKNYVIKCQTQSKLKCKILQFIKRLKNKKRFP